MQQEFSKTFNSRFDASAKYILALSGGADSVCLLHLMRSLNINFIAAHCNFNLRGEESDEDQRFVEKLCTSEGVQLHVMHFQTANFAKENGVSIEMAARELRYTWFEKLLLSEQARFIATAHHLNDNVETFFLNLTRGTGIKGLVAMKYINGNIVRPLLSFSRKQIEQYCIDNSIFYRNDATNAQDVYKRNYIRHNIVPKFEELNPSFLKTMMLNFDTLNKTSKFIDSTIDEIKHDIVAESDPYILISLKKVSQLHNKNFSLFSILHEYGFNGSQVSRLCDCIEAGESGKQFFSSSHRLVLDRYNIFIEELKETLSNDTTYFIDDNLGRIGNPVNLSIEKVDIEQGKSFEIYRNNNIAQLDYDLMQYPLCIRKWKNGDEFRPLGMKSFKKLSDFFIDNKLSIIDKENTWLLLSGEDIVWVIGYRIDDRYKLTHKTKKCLHIKKET